MVGTPPYVFPPFGAIPNTWVLFGDGHFGPVSSVPGGASDEIFIIADTSGGDLAVALPDPATLPTPFLTVVNVKNWNGGIYELHIDPGVGLTIDTFADGIRTRTNNQGYRFRWGPSCTNPVDGWVCFETCFGGDEAGSAAGGVPPTLGVAACDATLPFWVTNPGAAADYQVLTAASGTYTKPVGAFSFVAVVGWGSGGSGGEGAANSSGDFTFGGTGGGGSARKIQFYAYNAFPASVTYAIHQGGASVPGRTCPPDTTGAGTNGNDGGASTLTETITGDIFFVGGGKGGAGGKMIAPDSAGGQGGSWDQNGTTLAQNVNGTSGFGAGSMSNNLGDETGNAECGGASGAGRESPGAAPNGGGSLHGGCGGGMGGWIEVAPLANAPATDGGSTGPVNGGGGAKGISGLPGSQNGTAGAAGVGLDGGQGGGGGGSMFTPNTSGAGAAGGAPGGGGSGSGAVFGSGTKKTGASGAGARGELRIYVR